MASIFEKYAAGREVEQKIDEAVVVTTTAN